MSRIRLVALAAILVVAVSAIASATASAAECKKEANGKFALCIGTTLVLTEADKLNVDIRTSGEYELAGAAITIKCAKLLETLTLMDALGGAITFLPFQLHFIECKVTKGEHCVLENELVLTVPLEGKVRAKEELEFYPEKGINFATITVLSSGGTCAVPGKDKVVTESKNEKEGPLCGAADAEKTQNLHLVECNPSVKSSMLFFAGAAATFKGNFDTVLLLSGVEDLWAIIEGL